MTTEIPFSPRVLELLASKICHDLVSPVGAITNGVEFWTEMGESATEDSMGLISHSASQAALRLQTFRLAYGAGGSEKHVGLSDIHDALVKYLDGARHELKWDINHTELDGMLPLGFCKTLLNLLILVADITPKGSQIEVKNSPHSTDIEVKATSDMIKLKEGYADILKGSFNDDLLDARNIHPYILMLLSTHYNLNISHELTEKEAIFLLSQN